MSKQLVAGYVVLLLPRQIGNKRIDCLDKRGEERIKAKKYNGFQTLNLNGRWGY